MQIPFSYLSNQSFPFGTGGNLHVLNGQTVTLTNGQVYDYANVTVDAGGVLQISEGNLWTVLGVKGVLTNNGIIRGILGNNSGGTWNTTSPTGEALSFTATQRNGGNGGQASRWSDYNGTTGNMDTLIVGGSGSVGLQGFGNGGGGAATVAGTGGDDDGGNGVSNRGGFGGDDGPLGALIYSNNGVNAINQGPPPLGQGWGTGASGASRGRHAQPFVIYTSVIQGNGQFLFNGMPGGKGGNSYGRTVTSPAPGENFLAGGAGGGGAGGNGSKLLIRHKAGTTANFTFNVTGGAGGAAGDRGFIFDTATGTTTYGFAAGAGQSGLAGSVDIQIGF